MARYLLLLLLFQSLRVLPSPADELAAFQSAAGPQRQLVHVVMDLGNRDLDDPLCTYGIDCGPPFMSEAAHRHLGAVYTGGEPVTAPAVFRAVLSAIVEDPAFDDLYLSLMVSNHHDNAPVQGEAGVGGGTVLLGYRRLREHRAEVLSTLASIPVPAADAAHHWQPRETYFEWWRYLRGGAVALGRNTAGNYGGSGTGPDFDASVIDGDRYLSPLLPDQPCVRLRSILFTLGLPERDADLDMAIASELALAPGGDFEQILDVLRSGGAGLSTPGTELALESTWVVTSRARAGKAGDYALAGGTHQPLFVEDPRLLQAQLTAALLRETRLVGHSLHTAFAADVFNPGQMLDDMYIPMFLPQSQGGWPGNLKKLKLRRSRESEGDTGDLTHEPDQVVDVRGLPALASGESDAGHLLFDALTFWTDAAALPPGDGSNVPLDADGPLVKRGGAGQKIDGLIGYHSPVGEPVRYFIGDTNTDTPVAGYPARQVFYEPWVHEPESGRALPALNADPDTAIALRPLLDPDGKVGDDTLLDLLRGARGQDIDNGRTNARGWLLGALIHSRPRALNYGATAGYSRSNPRVRIMFGSADGVFHIVENTDPDGRENGREVFAFHPRETLAALGRELAASTPASPPFHGVDGTPVVLAVDVNRDGTLDHAAGDEAYVYFGLRRGGAAYIALDISDPDAVPSLQWAIRPQPGGDFAELGLTFSTPVVGRVSYNGIPVDVLIFGGGYHGGWDESGDARIGKDVGAEDDTVGNAIFIVNARTGELVWKAVRGDTGSRSNMHYAHAGLVDSIPSAVAALETPEGLIHRLYVGDSGGAVWRVDLPPARGEGDNHRRDHWFITKLADLGADAGETGGAAGADRRFFHAPDIVQSFDADGDFDGVLIHSGNRADPAETVVENALFHIKDRHTVSGSASVRAENDASDPPGRFHLADLADQTACMTFAGDPHAGSDASDCAFGDRRGGWLVRYQLPGEKGVASPLLDGGRVFASTFTPGVADACNASPGRGRLYALRLADGGAVAGGSAHFELGDGFPAGVEPVGDLLFLPGYDGDLRELHGENEPENIKLLPSAAGRVYRTYWREPGADPL